MVDPAAFVRVVVENGWLQESDFLVADVGVSGGIASRWDAFGERLSAVGFDPLIAEVERLTAQETRPKVRYEAAFVGWDGFEAAFPPAERDIVRSRHIQPYLRSSACRADELRQQNYVRAIFNAGAPVQYAERHLTLDGYFAGSRLPDFIKVDTDGFDYAVLLGARDLLRNHVLGLNVELQFHGALHEYGNTFANIDRFLRECGFSLFDLTLARYSRSALPAPFEFDIPAQTVSGQVGFADGLYLRDLAHPRYDEMFAFPVSRERAIKACCLFVLFGLDDCAAEMLVRQPALTSWPERQLLLDLLTPPVFGPLSYHDYVERFEADPSAFLPSHMAAMRVSNTPRPGEWARMATPPKAVTVPAVHLESIVTRPAWQPARVTRTERGVKVITASTPWSYAAEIGVDRTQVRSDAPCFLRVLLKVGRGVIGVGAVSADGTQFLNETLLPAGTEFSTVSLSIASLDQVQRIIIRNCDVAHQESVVTIRAVELLQIPAADAMEPANA